MTKPMSMSNGIELNLAAADIAGNVRLGLPTRAVELPAGRLLVIAPGLAHDVEAVTDSSFLLTLARGAQG